MTIDLLTEDLATVSARTAVELRKMGAELKIAGASKGRKSDLIAAIILLVVEAKKVEAERVAAAKVEAPAKPKSGCEDCGRKISKFAKGTGLCEACLDYAGWENTHSDDSHEQFADSTDEQVESMVECPVCHPELDPRTARKSGRSRAGMVIVAKGSEFHKSATFKEAAEAAGWTVNVLGYVTDDEETERYVATATRASGNNSDKDVIELAWNGRAYDYPTSSATLGGRVRKVRNLKEALRLL